MPSDFACITCYDSVQSRQLGRLDQTTSVPCTRCTENSHKRSDGLRQMPGREDLPVAGQPGKTNQACVRSLKNAQGLIAHGVHVPEFLTASLDHLSVQAECRTCVAQGVSVALAKAELAGKITNMGGSSHEYLLAAHCSPRKSLAFAMQPLTACITMAISSRRS